MKTTRITENADKAPLTKVISTTPWANEISARAPHQPVRWCRPGDAAAREGIDTLVLAGVSTSGVVLSTVRHAGDLDYRLVVVRDCCADPDLEVHAMLLDIVIVKQAAVVTMAELAGALLGRSS